MSWRRGKADGSGFKYIFVQEAKELFGENLDDGRVFLETFVNTIDYSAAESGGDIVVKTDKGSFSAPHVVSTFSVGVLQNQDVKFEPKLPDWKKEAIFTFGMALYQKIFLLFDEQFWGDEQVGRRARWADSSTSFTATLMSVVATPSGKTSTLPDFSLRTLRPTSSWSPPLTTLLAATRSCQMKKSKRRLLQCCKRSTVLTSLRPRTFSSLAGLWILSTVDHTPTGLSVLSTNTTRTSGNRSGAASFTFQAKQCLKSTLATCRAHGTRDSRRLLSLALA